MDDSDTDGRGGRRRRPVVIADEAERKRRRQQRRAAVRERESLIDAAEKTFYAAVDEIARIEAGRDDQLTELEDRARRIRADADTGIAEQQHHQIRAVGQLREQGCTADQIAAALDLAVTRVRVMLNENRRLRNTAAAHSATSGIADSSSAAEHDSAKDAGADPAADADGDQHSAAGPAIEPRLPAVGNSLPKPPGLFTG